MSEESTLRERATYATTYWVDLPQSSIEFHLNDKNPLIDALLTTRGEHQWAFLTAYNPHVTPGNPIGNQQRLKRLMGEVSGLGFEFLPGRDASDDNTLAPEACLFIFGMPSAEAQRLGQKFGQAAVIIGQKEQLPQLLYAEKK